MVQASVNGKPVLIDIAAAWKGFEDLGSYAGTTADQLNRVISNQAILKERVEAMELRLSHLEDLERRMWEMEARLGSADMGSTGSGAQDSGRRRR